LGQNHGYKVDLLGISPDEHAYGKPRKRNCVTIEVIGDEVCGTLQFKYQNVPKLKRKLLEIY
jgi:hypothetical protein